jgi:hypothetical protein
MAKEEKEHKPFEGGDWGPEQVKEILETISDKIPSLLNNMSDVLYSKENAEKFGHAVALFYKQLVEAGMSPGQAFELTQRYMSSLSPLQSIGSAFVGRGEKGRGPFRAEDKDE